MLSFIFWVAVMILDIVFLVLILKDVRKVKKEYGECFDLEDKRIKNIPKPLRKLSKNMVPKIIFHLCHAFNLPQPDLIRLGVFPCGLSVAGEYRIKQCKIILSFHGLRKFNMATIVHELAHHYEVIYHYNFKHDEKFLQSEVLVFDKLEELIRLKIVGANETL